MDNRFWRFQAVFWLLAGLALFLSGVSQMPVAESFVRNAFLLCAGFLGSFFLAYAADQTVGHRVMLRRSFGYATGYAVALFSVVTINAISFTLRGMALNELSLGQWFSGALNLGLVNMLWTELYLQKAFVVRSGAPVQSLMLEHQGARVRVPVTEVLLISAAGDYVEVHTAQRIYLERQTMAEIEQKLAGEDFLRIHRSSLINGDHVSGVRPLGRGRFRLELSNGQTVESSRRHQHTIESRLLDSMA